MQLAVFSGHFEQVFLKATHYYSPPNVLSPFIFVSCKSFVQVVIKFGSVEETPVTLAGVSSPREGHLFSYECAQENSKAVRFHPMPRWNATLVSVK